jgi:hypothetical protein
MVSLYSMLQWINSKKAKPGWHCKWMTIKTIRVPSRNSSVSHCSWNMSAVFTVWNKISLGYSWTISLTQQWVVRLESRIYSHQEVTKVKGWRGIGTAFVLAELLVCGAGIYITLARLSAWNLYKPEDKCSTENLAAWMYMLFCLLQVSRKWLRACQPQNLALTLTRW